MDSSGFTSAMESVYRWAVVLPVTFWLGSAVALWTLCSSMSGRVCQIPAGFAECSGTALPCLPREGFSVTGFVTGVAFLCHRPVCV